MTFTVAVNGSAASSQTRSSSSSAGTIRPPAAIRYSRTANSFGLSASRRPARVAVRRAGSTRRSAQPKMAGSGGPERRLALSPKEFAVLEYLMAAGGRIVSAEELLERVWDEAADPFTATVKVTVGRLRAKLGGPPLIDTVREGGYRIGGS